MKYAFPILLIAGLWAATIAIFLDPGRANFEQTPHPKYGNTAGESYQMAQGGDGASRHRGIKKASLLLGTLTAAGLTFLIIWSAASGAKTTLSNRKARRLFFGLMLFGLVIYESAFGLIFMTYKTSLGNPADQPFFGPFPTPTSWIFCGVWLAPVFFVVLYVVFFHRWIFPPESVERFTQILENQRHTDSETPSD